MKKTYQITEAGKQELELELEGLRGRRSEVADRIAEARNYGDLSENAEYDTAREDQAQLESRISEIEDILTNASIIKVKNSSRISVGSTVELKSGAKTVTYTVVGPVEANPLEGKISDESPIGEALMGKRLAKALRLLRQKVK